MYCAYNNYYKPKQVPWLLALKLWSRCWEHVWWYNSFFFFSFHSLADSALILVLSFTYLSLLENRCSDFRGDRHLWSHQERRCLVDKESLLWQFILMCKENYLDCHIPRRVKSHSEMKFDLLKIEGQMRHDIAATSSLGFKNCSYYRPKNHSIVISDNETLRTKRK